MTLDQFFSEHHDKLASCIHRHIDDSILSNPVSVGSEGLKLVKESVTEGKLIRGMVVLMSARIHGVPISDEQYHVAAAIEILHTALLIHDDIADRDLTRRGVPSLYSRYISEGTEKKVSQSEHYGASMALCVGDLLFFLVTEIIAREIHDPKTSRRISGIISRELQYVCSAQMMDISFGLSDDVPTESEIDLIYTYKTAHYTFSLPLVVGALFASKHDEKSLRTLGREMGIIFQLKDDELGMFGTTQEIGKEVGSDIRENKKTLMRQLLFAAASPSDHKKLSVIFGNPDIQHEDITFVQERLQSYHIPQLIETQIQNRSKIIESQLSEYENRGKDVSILQELLTYIANRKK